MSYLLFAGDDYYALGGAEDLQGKYSTIQDAINAHDPSKFDIDGGWANILCIETMAIVNRFNRGIWHE